MQNKVFPMSSEGNDTNLRFPDFIIAGAMKCGTTSLHNILSTHPKIFIPDREIHFFDIDDLSQHPDFFMYSNGAWYYPNLENDFEKYLNWYGAFFSSKDGTYVIGEDSTTYLASQKAPERIRRLIPNVKIIIMLRDPATRTYSHYWHLLRTGRATYSFEDSLTLMAGNLIQRSLYKKQIQNYLNYFDRENIYFIIFEDFIQNIQRVVDEVCKFLNVSTNSIDIRQTKTHYNPTRLPRYPNLQIFRNRIMKISTHPTYFSHLVDIPDDGEFNNKRLLRVLDKLHQKINPHNEENPPSMNPATRNFLNEYFFRENYGLDNLINRDTNSYWYFE
ncbi:MAG: sulfotransferase [Chloroflexota bacterium]|nr:MAG: sulfotransferase [Chloroflexota bacterium]